MTCLKVAILSSGNLQKINAFQKIEQLHNKNY